MKYYYLQILLVAIGYTPIVAQNEIAAKGASESILLECPNTPLKGLQESEIKLSSTALDTTLEIPLSSPAKLPGSPQVHFVDEVPRTDSLSLFSDGTTNLDPAQPVIIDALFVYPNPSSGMVQVKLPGKVSIQVYTLAGQLISRHQLPPGERMLDLSALPDGIYQIRAKSDEDYFSGKLLIQ